MPEPSHSTHVAVREGTVVGFVDGFVTRAGDGATRWEVDLLAVDPCAQGRGLGRGLVAANIAAGSTRNVAYARALIRTGNIGSERAFAACGFAPDPFESELWVAGDLMTAGEPVGLHVVPVRTFRYSGTWLEAVSASGLRALRPDTGRHTVGSVIPLADGDVLRAAIDAGLQPVGRFRFWHRAMKTLANMPFP
jgi:GNAT superfamily N-acetyltransferase